MRRLQIQRSRTFPLVVGLAAIGLLLGMLYLATVAQKGLPWQSRYRVTVEFPNAERLIATDDVDIGGVRVGQVSKVTVVPSSHAGQQAYVRVSLALDPSAGPLPVDTRVAIRSSSVLGATYVDVRPGSSSRKVPNGGVLPLANSKPTVQLTDLFDIFNSATARDVQATLGELAPAFAGRGAELNTTIGELSRLLPEVTVVSRVLAAPSTQLGGFIRAYGSFVAAIAPVTTQLAGLATNGAATFGAIAKARSALGSTIDQLPGTEDAVTSALTRLEPTLNRLAGLAVTLRPGAQLLPATLDRINPTLAAGVRPLRELPRFADRLQSTLGVLQRVSVRKATDGAVRELTAVVKAALPTITTLEAGQVHCDILPQVMVNWASLTEAFGIGTGPPFLPFALTHAGAQGETLQQGKPSSNVDVNYVPIEDSSECVSGNEPANAVTQRFNNPSENVGSAHPTTTPPPGVFALGQKAGLLTPPKGWRP